VNSWAVIFPYDEEYVYSNIIEQVHKNFRLGNGNCSRVTMTQQPTMPMQPKQTGGMDPTTQAKQMAAMDPTVPKQMVGVMPPQRTAAMEPAAQPKQAVAMEPALPPKRMAAMQPAMPPKMGGTDMGWVATYSNDKHGFSLSYPASQFLALPPATADGFQAVSRDGKARLRAGTIANFDGKSLGAYRSFLLAEAYPGAKLDDAPSLNDGFVLSGVKSDGATGFYRRVSFTCGGSNVNSLTVVYPAAEKPVYAPVIEQVSKAYRLGDGNCGRMTMVQPK
jgi:hypothetical protein